MELETFAEAVRLGGIVRFVLWQSAFEFDVPEQILRDEAGRVPAFATPNAASAYAATRQLKLSDHAADVDPTWDLDALVLWADDPRQILDHGAIRKTWKFLTDAGLLPGMHEDGLDPALQEVVWQLDSAELAAIDPKSAHLAPKWADAEVALLARTLRDAIAEFAKLLTVPPAV
jgi:hypothetical protein